MQKTHRHDSEGCVDDAGADGGIHRLLHPRLLKDACGVIENLRDTEVMGLGQVRWLFPGLCPSGGRTHGQ